MAEVYVTLSEAAELEGVQYQTMARRTQRNKKNFVTKTEKSETGGRDVVLVAVSSLSKTDILQPSDDMVLEQDKVIMAGDINVTVRNVVQSARGKE